MTSILVACFSCEWYGLFSIYVFFGIAALLTHCSNRGSLLSHSLIIYTYYVKGRRQHVASLLIALTKCCVISTAIGVTSSLYSQIIFCMTLVRSSFSVSLTMCRSACITGRMKEVMYSLAKEYNKGVHLDTQTASKLHILKRKLIV